MSLFGNWMNANEMYLIILTLDLSFKQMLHPYSIVVWDISYMQEVALKWNFKLYQRITLLLITTCSNTIASYHQSH